VRRQPSPQKKKKKPGRKSPAGSAFIHDTAAAAGAGGAGGMAEGAGGPAGDRHTALRSEAATPSSDAMIYKVELPANGAGGRADGAGGRADGAGGRADGAGGRADGAGGRAVSVPKAHISNNNIDMGSRLPAAESGLGGELSWDPEDCSSSFGGERSSGQSTPRSASKYGEHESGGNRGGGGAAARLASENLRILKENEAVKAENAQLKRTIARLRMRLVAAGEDEGDGENGENVDSSRGGGGAGGRSDVFRGRSEVSLDPSAWAGLGVASEDSFDPSEFGREPQVHADHHEDEEEEEEEYAFSGGGGKAARRRARGGGGEGGGARYDIGEQLSFDPSEFEGGGNSDAAGETVEPDKCGIGVTLHCGDDGLLRIISLTHGALYILHFLYFLHTHAHTHTHTHTHIIYVWPIIIYMIIYIRI
jgi:hypothetical protein